MDHNRKLSEIHLAPKGASILSQNIDKNLPNVLEEKRDFDNDFKKATKFLKE